MKMQQTLKGYGIVIVDKGFVYVGDFEVTTDWCIVKEAKNIRVWATKNGLGELALEGPSPNTKLDSCGVIHVPIHALITILETERQLWIK